MTAPREGDFQPFVATSWSLVNRAADRLGRPGSLGQLLKVYLPALQTYLRVERGLSTEKAEDLLQGFVADKIVEQNLIARADRDKGKFRTFLLVALNRYIIDQFRYDNAAKRAPGAVANIEERPDLISNDLDPSRQFDLAWAQELVSETLRRMKQECEKSGRDGLWAIFESRVVGPVFHGNEIPAYEKLVEQLGLQTPAQASNLLTTAKRMFGRMLRSVAMEYAGSPEFAEEEIKDLKAIISNMSA